MRGGIATPAGRCFLFGSLASRLVCPAQEGKPAPQNLIGNDPLAFDLFVILGSDEVFVHQLRGLEQFVLGIGRMPQLIEIVDK